MVYIIEKSRKKDHRKPSVKRGKKAKKITQK